MKPTVPEVLPLVMALYERDLAGCCLHIVLDDYNVSDDHVKHCIGYAVDREHWQCCDLANQLLMMSKTQRLKLARSH